MVSWDEFSRQAPELGRLALERFHSTELVLLGTTRADGWPRITPVEFTIFDGDFVIGMMWQSKKALDLLRDGRCVIHSTTSDKDGKQGDAKLYATARPLEEDRVEPYWQHIFAKLDWRPDGPAHAFVFDIRSAAFVRFTGEEMQWMTWPGPREWKTQPGEG
jgi:hypothetical protein